MGDILCTIRKKGTENINPLHNISVLDVNRNVNINSTKQTQNPSLVGDGEVKYLINDKKGKSKKKDKNRGPQSQGKKDEKMDREKDFIDKTTNGIISNEAALGEIKKQIAHENKSNKKMTRSGDNELNNEDSTQSLSTRRLSRSNDIEESESDGNTKNNGTDVKTDRDSNVDSNDDDDDDDEQDTEEEEEEEDTDEEDTDEEDTDEEDTDEDETDEENTDELDFEEDNTNKGSIDRDIEEGDNAADEKRLKFKENLHEKFKSSNYMIKNNYPDKPPLHPFPLQPSSLQMTNNRKEDTIKPVLLFNIGTGMTAHSIKELLPNNNNTLLDSTRKQFDLFESINVSANGEETGETQLTKSLKKNSLFNKKYTSF